MGFFDGLGILIGSSYDAHQQLTKGINGCGLLDSPAAQDSHADPRIEGLVAETAGDRMRNHERTVYRDLKMLEGAAFLLLRR